MGEGETWAAVERHVVHAVHLEGDQEDVPLIGRAIGSHADDIGDFEIFEDRSVMVDGVFGLVGEGQAYGTGFHGVLAELWSLWTKDKGWRQKAQVGECHINREVATLQVVDIRNSANGSRHSQIVYSCGSSRSSGGNSNISLTSSLRMLESDSPGFR